ncbi:hypothetical protein NCCP2495_21360 [Dietzia sp. NCCP-2495]|uniref:ABC transporter permease n=1 Tax=Dietzia sp. NCCP-2495 TaxID=2934675 RepID=UPI00280EB2CA|nr:ABC transporter permease [Dietzia sp. NCCP-2495]GLB64257.1 hypothetical protein NCCP2495_21360 [Dietzia sp. NCCP-2495]
MSARAVATEFAKMKHLRIGMVAVIMGAAVVLLSLYAVVSSPTFSPEDPGNWNALLAGMSLGFPLISPLLLAVVASRTTDIEHQGRGWVLQSTAGITSGVVCRAKLVALGTVVAATTIGTSLVVLAAGELLIRIGASVPLGHWAGFTLCVLVVNLTILALHIVLSATVENQLVALGVGVLGCVVAVFSQGLPPAAAHVTPWGYYALATAADHQGERFVTLPLSYPSIAALAVVVGALFALITTRFNRQEA